MEKEVVTHHHHSNGNGITTSLRQRHITGDSLLRRQTLTPPPPQSAEFVLRWGNRKRLRCMKIQVRDESNPVHKTTVRVDRQLVRPDNSSGANASANLHHQTNGSGHFNLRQRPVSPAWPPPTHRILRNSESAAAMKGQSNGVRGLSSSDRAHDKKHNQENGGRTASSSETAEDSKKGGWSPGSDAIPALWPPKFVIALTNKEKEEDFMAIKGSKLPQRPKKRAKFIQRTLNLVSPGGWLCDLTLERYEVREKKISKKRARGLKAMGCMDSDSE
ncbi:hypothetical protein Ancab_022949 [Ancistrocladus abbreviatus]